jgi:hypothetical protein
MMLSWMRRTRKMLVIRKRNRKKKLCTVPFGQRESSKVAVKAVTPITSDQTGSQDAESLPLSCSLENKHISLHISSQKSLLRLLSEKYHTIRKLSKV